MKFCAVCYKIRAKERSCLDEMHYYRHDTHGVCREKHIDGGDNHEKILKMTLKENKVKKKTESFTKTNENPTEKNVVENKNRNPG